MNEQQGRIGAQLNPVSLIFAMTLDGGIGFEGKIPWRDQPWAKQDFAYFQKTTNNRTVIMGRYTYEEIVEMQLARSKDISHQLLPKRNSIVVSSSLDSTNKGITVVRSLRGGMEHHYSTDPNSNAIVIGGEKLFIEALPFTNTIYMTVVNGSYKCDTFVPIKYIEREFRNITTIEGNNNLVFLVLSRSVPIRI